MDGISVNKLKKEIHDLAVQLQTHYFPTFERTRYPWILVWPFPVERKTKSGVLWVPDTQRGADKTHRKGLVLSCWGQEYSRYLREETSTGNKIYLHVPDFKVGDIVAFPHHTGWPVSEESAQEFRLIPEHEIFGLVDFELQPPDAAFSQRIHSLLDGTDGMKSEFVSQLLQEWLVYPRDTQRLLDGANSHTREEAERS